MSLLGRLALFCWGAAVLSGCTPAPYQGEDVTMRGQAPRERLHLGQLELAEADLDEGGDSDADGFAPPAVDAAGAGDGAAEAMNARAQTAEAVEAITIMRGSRVEVIRIPIVEEKPAAPTGARPGVNCRPGPLEEGSEAAASPDCRASLLDGLDALRAKPLAATQTAPPAAPETAAVDAETMPGPTSAFSGAGPLSEAAAPDAPKVADEVAPAAEPIDQAASGDVAESQIAGTYIVFFGSDTAELSPEAREILAEVVRAAKSSRFSAIRASGHSDPMGSEDDNDWLSEQRTLAVVDFLVASGLDKQRIVTESYGSTDPLVSAAGEQAQLQNRRVEVQFLR